MTLSDLKGLGRGAASCLGVIALYGLLLAWAISNEGIGLGLLALGIYLATKINALEGEAQKRQRLVAEALQEQFTLIQIRLRDMESLIEDLQSDINRSHDTDAL